MALAKKYKMQFAEVSAKTGSNVNRAIDDLVEGIVRGQLNVLPWKDIYMQWLLFLDEDCDDDLLQDAMEILAGE